ncbi:hypothetical protein CRD18_00015 [Corynebacterium sp. LK31]|nr:hypothetical protein [Corynebacterium sp. LK31]OFL69302.1 hypothetical protein HMPREF2752_04285 [Corynebacterium sp. HMSC077C02]
MLMVSFWLGRFAMRPVLSRRIWKPLVDRQQTYEQIRIKYVGRTTITGAYRQLAKEPMQHL